MLRTVLTHEVSRSPIGKTLRYCLYLSGEGCYCQPSSACLPPPASCSSLRQAIAVVSTRPGQQALGQSDRPPDLNCKLVIAVVPAGPKQQAPDQSVPRRASTASATSQWSPSGPEQQPGLKMTSAGPQLQTRDRSGPAGPATTTGLELKPEKQALDQKFHAGPRRHDRIRVFLARPQPHRISEDIPDTMPEKKG